MTSEEYGYQQKLINKKLRKEKKKYFILEGNINHALNPINLPDTFEFTGNDLHKVVVKNAGTKRALNNPHMYDNTKYKDPQIVSIFNYLDSIFDHF